MRLISYAEILDIKETIVRLLRVFVFILIVFFLPFLEETYARVNELFLEPSTPTKLVQTSGLVHSVFECCCGKIKRK